MCCRMQPEESTLACDCPYQDTFRRLSPIHRAVRFFTSGCYKLIISIMKMYPKVWCGAISPSIQLHHILIVTIPGSILGPKHLNMPGIRRYPLIPSQAR